MPFDSNYLPASLTEQRVSDVRHWTDELFSFRLSRPQGFRFRSGEFVMLGLVLDGKPLLRAYSIASAAWDDGLDFYSIKVPDGPLTSKLQNIKKDDSVILGKKPTGTIVLDALLPGRRLFLLSTGTGVAPFASLIRDPETFEKYESVVLTHTCRNIRDLAYSKNLIDQIGADPLVGEEAANKLSYYPTVTREDFANRGRITDLMRSGRLFTDLNVEPFNPQHDRIMICGSTAMIAETRQIAEAEGFEEGSNAAPGQYVVEKAFAD